MTGTEIKDALMNGRHVIFNGIEYNKVSAIVYRNNNGKVAVSAELTDKNQNSIVIAPIDKIQDLEETND